MSHQVVKSPPQKPKQIRHVTRWGIVASLPLVLLCLLAFSLQDWQVAKAATYNVGNCVGIQTHSTINQAVAAAGPDDIINICPGTYDESINLSLMGTIGSITLRQTPATSGDVNIEPTVGAGIWITRQATFNGNITLVDLNITAESSLGIDFGHTYFDGLNYLDGGTLIGDVTLNNVNASNNGDDGAYIRSYNNISITNSIFDGNAQNGLQVLAQGNVAIVGTQANGNGQGVGIFDSSGIVINTSEILMACNVNAEETFNQVLIESTTASNNRGWGIYERGEYDTTITNTTTISNGLDGVYVDLTWPTCSMEIPDLTVSNSLAQSNGLGYGLKALDADYPLPGMNPGGFRLVSAGELNVDNADAIDNYSFGFCLYSYNAIADVTNSLSKGSAGDGYFYGQSCDSFGIGSVGVNSESTTTPEAPIQAADAGFSSVTISSSTSISNANAGFLLNEEYSTYTLTKVTANNNQNGILVTNELMLGPTSVGEVEAAAPPSVLPSAYVQNSLIQGNSQNGILYEQRLTLSIDYVVTTTTYINSNIICENGTGLRVDQLEDNFGDWSIQIAYPEGASNSVDARGNWWGSATGPAATGNPTGTGNGVEFAVLNPPTSTVAVEYAPWISQIATTATPNPTLVSIPVEFGYLISDAGVTYLLQEGVGDPNNGPIFTLVPTNGVINGTPNRFLVNGEITANVTPQTAGPMNLQLQGPCGLTASNMVNVVAPVIAIDKSPDAQGVPSGGTAIFTVTVTNVGTADLTNITVTDLQAPNCSRASGAIANLAPGQSNSYTCALDNVTADSTNSITAQAVALIDGAPAGSPVSDTDQASVYIASFTLKKTAFVAGFRELLPDKSFNPSDCALSSDITVPVSTTVKYCYTITNTGNYTLSTHSLIDSHFPNAILTNAAYELAPGESISTVDLGASAIHTLYVDTTNVATWTAKIAAPVQVVGIQAEPAVINVVGTTQAVVNISPDDLDQDGDGIPDNVEGSLDVNGNGIPAYLDPIIPTNESPTQQPNPSGRLFLPSLGNNE